MGCQQNRPHNPNFETDYEGEHVTTLEEERPVFKNISNIKIMPPLNQRKHSKNDKNNNTVMENLIKYQSTRATVDNSDYSQRSPYNSFISADNTSGNIQQVKKQYDKINDNGKMQNNYFSTNNEQSSKIGSIHAQQKTNKPHIHEISKQYQQQAPHQMKQQNYQNEESSILLFQADQKQQQEQSQIQSKQFSLRIGKDINQCQQEILQVQDYVNIVILPEMSQSNSCLTPHIAKIKNMIQVWIIRVYSKIIKKSGEIRSYVTIRSNNDYIKISHEIISWKDFEILENFARENNLIMDVQYLNQMKKNYSQIKALNTNIWLEFTVSSGNMQSTQNGEEINQTESSNQLEISIGVQGSQPYDESILKDIIDNQKEKQNILHWYNETQPIVTDFGFIINSQFHDEIYDFYIFENDEETNLHKTLLAFYNYGATFERNVLKELQKLPSSDFHVLFHLNKFGLLRLRMILNNMKDDQEDILLSSFGIDKDQIYAWKTISQKAKDYSQKQYHMLELNPDGFLLYKTADLGKEIGSLAYFDQYQ